MSHSQDTQQGKTIAILSYFTFIGTLIAAFMHNDNPTKFSAFHLRQAIGIMLTNFVIALVIGWFDSWLISTSFWVFILVIWLYGFIGAVQGKYQDVPILGSYFQQWFSSLIKDN